MILLNDLARQWQDVRDDVLSATADVGASGRYVLGQAVTRFERSLAPVFSRRHAVGCASGLDAIEIGLRILGIGPGDKVLTTPLTAFATTLAILRAGAQPAFADVDGNGQIDLARCERRLARDPRIRAFVPVHLYGYPLDLAALAELKTRFDLAVVEDAAQAIGAAWAGRPVGSVGQVAATSFYPTKNLGCLGDCGALLIDDPELAGRAANLRNYVQSARYHHDQLGLNSRLDELQAALLERAFLPRLPAWTERRRMIAQRYLREITHPKVRVLQVAPEATPCWHLYPVFVPTEHRPDFQAHVQAGVVQTGIHYPRVVPEQAALAGSSIEVAGSGWPLLAGGRRDSCGILDIEPWGLGGLKSARGDVQCQRAPEDAHAPWRWLEAFAAGAAVARRRRFEAFGRGPTLKMCTGCAAGRTRIAQGRTGPHRPVRRPPPGPRDT